MQSNICIIIQLLVAEVISYELPMKLCLIFTRFFFLLLFTFPEHLPCPLPKCLGGSRCLFLCFLCNVLLIIDCRFKLFLFVVLLSVVRFATSDYYVSTVNHILYLTVPIALHSFRIYTCSCQVKYTKYHLRRKLIKRVFIMCN